MINVLVWLVWGGLAGWAASRLIRTFQGAAPLLQVVAGSLGALLGGVIFLIFDTAPLSMFNVRGLAAALIGALVIIGVVHVAVERPI